MTAEVVVMNKTGVALASDSVVTIENGNKFYNTANKLFNLSQSSHVGIMAYNSASFMGFPIEIVIKEYRKNLQGRTFSTLRGYWNDFVDYLAENFKRENEAEYFLSEVYRLFSVIDGEIKERINAEIKESIESKIRENAEEPAHDIGDLHRRIIEVTDEIIDREIEVFRECPADNSFMEKESQIRDKYSDQIRELIKEVLGTHVSEGSSEKLIDMGVMILTKDHDIGLRTGIVIAGFGEKELFPSVVSGEFMGIFLDQLKYKKIYEISVDDTNTCSVVPFAQYDIIHSFMEGMDIEVLDQIELTIDEFLEKYKDEQRSSCLEELKTTIKERIAESSRVNHVDPIMSTIEIAPKEELARMAETLINVAAFRRNLSRDPFSQSVGGPIDVALISKGDGFVWIRRKQYFDKDLNYNFFANRPLKP